MELESAFVSEENRWEAVVNRNRDADGFFYYAVRTTGVYCRPGCSSRLPRRENIEFFDDWSEAESAGYRACKRCEPDSVAPSERLAETIVQACRHLEQAETPPTLQALAAEVGLSPGYFHRLFKKIVGVTPKQYAIRQQVLRFQDNLDHSGSVTEAIYDSGFSSSSRAYGSAGERLGMTPSEYRQGASGIMIRYGIARSFLGWVLVASTDRGICAIEFDNDPETLLENVQKRFPEAHFEEAESDFSAVTQQIITFIEAPEDSIDLPLDIQGTAFQERVWHALREIPAGSTATYGEIAERIGQPKAGRAVAQACAANKLAVAVPCHRVIRSDGKLGGYRWGTERKQQLLHRERSIAEK